MLDESLVVGDDEGAEDEALEMDVDRPLVGSELELATLELYRPDDVADDVADDELWLVTALDSVELFDTAVAEVLWISVVD